MVATAVGAGACAGHIDARAASPPERFTGRICIDASVVPETAPLFTSDNVSRNIETALEDYLIDRYGETPASADLRVYGVRASCDPNAGDAVLVLKLNPNASRTATRVSLALTAPGLTREEHFVGRASSNIRLKHFAPPVCPGGLEPVDCNIRARLSYAVAMDKAVEEVISILRL